MTDKVLGFGVAFIVVLWCLNYLSAYFFRFPFVYCWMPGKSLLASATYVAFLACTTLFVFWMFRGGLKGPALKWMAAVYLVALVPVWSETLFSLGLKCSP